LSRADMPDRCHRCDRLRRSADAPLPRPRRSPKKAQETWLKTHDSAVEQYGEGERAHRTPFKSLKHGWEKVDDRWARESTGLHGYLYYLY